MQQCVFFLVIPEIGVLSIQQTIPKKDGPTSAIVPRFFSSQERPRSRVIKTTSMASRWSSRAISHLLVPGQVSRLRRSFWITRHASVWRSFESVTGKYILICNIVLFIIVFKNVCRIQDVGQYVAFYMLVVTVCVLSTMTPKDLLSTKRSRRWAFARPTVITNVDSAIFAVMVPHVAGCATVFLLAKTLANVCLMQSDVRLQYA